MGADLSLAPAQRRAALLKSLLQWHWFSSAVCLVGLLVFAATGITLNHASQIESSPVTTRRQATLPGPLRDELARLAAGKPAGVPASLRGWLVRELAVELPADPAAEWSPDELYVSMPRPGGDAWVRIALGDGALEHERTDRGWIAYLNDLHKGRHTGIAWSWFIDLFAVGCLLFALTGLWILKLHAAHRPATWPLTALGLVLPLLLALLFIH